MAQSASAIGAHALVFGASGLAGWGVVDQLLCNYPAQGTFSHVTALVNRPFGLADSYWPESLPSRPKLQLVPHVNLLKGPVEDLTAFLKREVEGIGNVTHAFYFAYKQEQEPDVETKVNRDMIERAIGALNILSPNLKFVAFPSGTRGYGIHLPGGVFKAPFKESMGRLPAPIARNVFCFAHQDALEQMSKGREWTWCEVRPDAIIGFVPNGSTFNLPAHWATYLSLYALVEGKGAKVPFPGTIPAYNSLFNDASADIIAKFSIWASLHPERCGGGELFNIADQARPSSMSERWPAIAKYFGLEGVGPGVDGKGGLKPGEYIEKHKHVLEEWGGKGSRVFKAEALDEYGHHFTFDRHMSLEKVRKVGFEEEIEPDTSWFRAFDRLRSASMIPG